MVRKQRGSMVAEISAIIAAIGILTLIGTNYYNLIVAKAQFTEAFISAQPLINDVNNFYAGNGLLSSTGNYPGASLFDANSASGALKNKAGRYISSAFSYPNGVVEITFNSHFQQANQSDNGAGAINNTSSIIANKKVFFVPFKATEDNANPAPYLKWACMTTVNNDHLTGNILSAYTVGSTNQYTNQTFSPGCLVITTAQAAILDGLQFGDYTELQIWADFPDNVF